MRFLVQHHSTMAEKLVECPKCLGTKEIVVNFKRAKKCDLCDGEGKVSKVVEDAFISNIMDDTEY